MQGSSALMVGEQAPAIDSPTADDVDGGFMKRTSASESNAAFYELWIAGALANDKPAVVLFATPAFCQTRFCGPDYEITSDLQQRYGDQFNFVHVEGLFTEDEVVAELGALGVSSCCWSASLNDDYVGSIDDSASGW